MNKAFVFDFDDTIATTDCKVIVRRWGKEIARLTPAEYNSYPLADDCKFDYSEFRRLINPVPLFLLHLAKEVHDEYHSVYILTARGSAVRDSIADFLQTYGIKAKEIHCVGDSKENLELEKRKVLLTIMENYDRLYVYDDHKGNIDATPDSDKVRKYLV